MDTNSIKLVPFETFMESVEATRSEDPFYQEGRLTRFWDNVKNDLSFSKSEDNSDDDWADDWDDEDDKTPQKKESIIKRVLAIIKKIVTAIFKFIPTVVKNLRYIEPRHFKGKNANAKVYIVEKPRKLYNHINNHLLGWVYNLNTDEISRRLAKGITRILEGTDDYGSDADMKTRITALFFPYFLKNESDFSIFCKKVDNSETKDALNGQLLSIMKSKEFSFEANVSNVCKSINNGIGLEMDIKKNLGNVKPPVVEVTRSLGFTIDGNFVNIGRKPTQEDIQKLMEINSAIPQIFAEYAAKIKKLLEYHNMYITNLSNAINKIDPDVIKSYKEYVI